MFFRHRKATVPTFEDRIESLRQAGFTVRDAAPGAAPGGRAVEASRDGCAALIEDSSEGQALIRHAGLSMGGEIGGLVDGGFQKLFLAPGGRRTPALAHHLKALHAFTEDLREGLGLTSLYNESLGTVNSSHMYDRVEDRDAGTRAHPWRRVR